MNNENPNFFDTRTIMAIVLVAATFLGWNYYMQKKYPEAFKKKSEVNSTAAGSEPVQQDNDVADKKNPGATNPPVDVKQPEAPIVTREEKLTPYESENLAFQISSKGMGLKNVVLRKYKDRAGESIELGHPHEDSLAMETRLTGVNEHLDFDVRKVNDNMFVGRARFGAMEITKTLEIVPNSYVMNYKIATKGEEPRFIGVSTVLGEEVEEQPSGSFLMPQFAHQEFFIEGESRERTAFKAEDLQKKWSKVKVASVGSQYFTQAIVDKSPVMPEVEAHLNHKGRTAQMELKYPILNRAAGLELEYVAFMGPKSHQLLTKIDENLAHVVDFGFFNWIGRHILMLLNWFYGLVGNWGAAIILLTILVRVLVLPFNVYSFKSMKAMQALQPKIQALRERYKDDQQKANTEMMALMRENKVNPLGGCLPVLLQFPIFIALYQVLGISIELYQAPFALWIHDLSLKDPYYILPVLMGLTMFVQQKITPNTMDPAQAKVLMFMPILFTFFMVGLPSGLTLYMLVSSLFGVSQQMFFMRGSSNPVAAAAQIRRG